MTASALPPPLIGVVTVTYNSAPYLPAFFDSCWSQTLANHRVYCIDNASRDGTLAALATQTDGRLVVTPNADNVGVAAGNNQGIVQALADGCEWVLLLNNDTTFPATLFQQLVDACTSNRWQAVVPKMHFDTPRNAIWYGGGRFNAWRGHTGFHIGSGQPDVGQFDTPQVMPYAPTCCMLVHRSVFDRVGLMDETYFVYYDDTDFCWRMQRQQQVLGYWPAATLVHKVGGSTGGVTSPFTVRITARNRLYFVRKHFGLWAAWRWMAVFLPYYAVRYLLRSWHPASFRASLDGSLAFSKLKPHEPPLPQARP